MKTKKQKISRKGAIYRVALAGICSALSLLLVWLSVIARYGTLGFFAAAGIVLMIPLYKKYYVSGIFAYAVSAGLSVLVGDLASVMGYILYFGPMAIIMGFFVNKKIKWFLAIPIQIIYAVGMLAVLYYVFNTVIVRYDAFADVKFWLFALVGTIVLLAINSVQAAAYIYIVPRVGNVLRDDENRQSNAVDLSDDDENPFEEIDTFIVPAKKDEDKKDDENEGQRGDEK